MRCYIKVIQSGVYCDVTWSECTPVKTRYSSHSFLSYQRTKFSKRVKVTVKATCDVGRVLRVMKWIILFNNNIF